MSHLDEWAHLIARQLKSEAELVGTQAKSELYEDVARDNFIRVVLEPFLPGSYAVGTGRVIDSSGNISSPQDIVIYRRDYPQFNMPGSHHVFIYESVLATVQVRSKLVRKSFFSALDQCASMATLNPVIDPSTLRAMAKKMNMVPNTQQQYIHPDPLNTGRFDLIGRPHTFVYAFTGYQTSDRQLAENLSKWIDYYQQSHDVLQMKSLPSVIATQGCFGWRNTAPFAIKKRFLMGVGIDHAPLRLIFLQIMHALNRRLQNTSEGYGIKSTIAPYLSGFEPPAISETVGNALNPGSKRPASNREPESLPIANKQQSAATIQAKTTAEKQQPKKSARVARLVASASLAAGSNTPGPAENKSRDSQGSGPKPAEQPPVADVAKKQAPLPESASGKATALASSDSNNTQGSVQSEPQPAKIPPSPVSVERETKEPLIENLSRRPPAGSGSAVAPISEGARRAKPGSPLSMFSDASEESIEEYDFKPIDRPRSSDDEVEAQQKTSETDDVSMRPTRRVNAVDVDNPDEDEGEFLKTQQFSSPPSKDLDEEVDSAFLDTLVESAESLAEDKSEVTKTDKEYVTESLI